MENIKFQIVKYDSDLYKKSVDLRYLVLRKPLNMVFTENDAIADSKDTHIVGLHPEDPKKVISVCILVDKGNNLIKTRQVGVAEEFQRRGIGQKMIEYAEGVAVGMGAKKIEASSRQYALSFYVRLGYKVDPVEYVEVGIPHQKVYKEM